VIPLPYADALFRQEILIWDRARIPQTKSRIVHHRSKHGDNDLPINVTMRGRQNLARFFLPHRAGQDLRMDERPHASSWKRRLVLSIGGHSTGDIISNAASGSRTGGASKMRSAHRRQLLLSRTTRLVHLDLCVNQTDPVSPTMRPDRLNRHAE